MASHPLAVVTGASSGIGLSLAKVCARRGNDLVIASDEPEIQRAAESLRDGVSVEAVETDLSSPEGVDRLLAAIGNRAVDLLVANAGRGLGGAFVDQPWSDIERVIHTNVTGTLYLVHLVARAMKHRGQGRILIVGSIAGYMPGTFQAVYNGTKAMLDSFAYALRDELAGSGVTVTCLMPGATDTRFFERAHMEDTKVGSDKKMSPDEVARQGYDAAMHGAPGIVTGWQNKLRSVMAHVTPQTTLAKLHRKMAQPGTAKH